MDPIITTALIGGTAAVVAAAVPTWLTIRTNRRVGTSDGHGTLMEMTAEILGIVRDHATRLTVLERDRRHGTDRNGGKPQGGATGVSEETSERG